MAVITRSVGSFNKISAQGATVYGAVQNFDMPDFSSIDSVIATFATHSSSGSTADRAFAINGARAHGSGDWASSGISLNAGLIVAGNNTFRITLKAQTGSNCKWDIGPITLTITYTEPGGGGGGTTDPGVVSVNKTVITAGETLTISVSGAAGGVYRDVYLRLRPSMSHISTVVAGHGSGTGSWTITIPESWCASYAPNSNSFSIRVYMVSYLAGGASVGDGARDVTINVPATALPTITDFDIERIANVPGAIGGFVKGYSGIAYEITGAVGALGSTIASYSVTADGKTETTADGEIGPLVTAGEVTITAVITDSRGRTVTASETVMVLDYQTPTILLPTVVRATSGGAASPVGTYIKATGELVYSSLDGDNEAALYGRLYEKGGTPTSFDEITDGEWLESGAAINKTWIVELKAVDLIGEYLYVVEIPTSRTHMNAYPSEIGGVAFGGYAEEEDAAVFKYTKVKHFDKYLLVDLGKNILHNWDFRDPVNQRDGSGTISSGDYFFDRWIRQSGSVTVDDGYLAMANGATIEQRIEGHGLVGETVTVSARAGSDVFSGSGVFPASGTETVTLDGFGSALLGYHADYLYVRFTASGTQNVVSVKLEMGDQSTLRLDPPMDRAAETLKCQRYFLYLNRLGAQWFWFGAGYNPAGNSCDIGIYLPVPLRSIPTLKRGGSFGLYLGTSAGVSLNSFSVRTNGFSPESVLLPITVGWGDSSLGTNQPFRLISASATTPGWIALSSDL